MQNSSENHFYNPVVMVLLSTIVAMGAYLYYDKNSQSIDDTQPPQQEEIDILKEEVENLKNQKPETVVTEVEKEPVVEPTKNQTNKIQVTSTYIAERSAMLHCLQIEGTEKEIRELYDASVYEPAFEGSSVIISSRGEILTNAHVVGVAPLCLVQTAKSPNYSVPSPSYFARVVSVNSDLDIAKLQIISDISGAIPSESFKFFEISNDLTPTGEAIYIAGFSTASNKRLAITEGIVSGYDDPSGYVEGVYLITSAKIDSGNSGGAALTAEGKLIGLPTYVMGNYDTLGYVLDLNRVKKIFSY